MSGTTKFQCLSLFTGAGGLDVGLDSTGRFNLRACIEVEPTFCETLRWNRDAGRFAQPTLQVINEDIRSLPPHEAMSTLHIAPGELDLLVGGPPCQAFSTAGRRQSVQDARGGLLWDYLDYIVAMRPRYFLMENVRGLLSAALRHRPIAMRPGKGGPPLAADELAGSVVQRWLRDLCARTDGEYRVDCFEVNAVNYGAPQLRERVLFIGNREGAVVEFPLPTHASPEIVQRDGNREPFRTLRDVIGPDVWHPQSQTVLDFSERKKHYLALVPSGGNWRTLPENIQRESMGRAWFAKGGRSGWWRRLSWELPSPTLVTLPNHASTSMCHPTEVRALSIEEYSAIQEFPRTWKFSGSLAKQYEQAGNAVPTALGRLAGEVLASYLARVPGAPRHDLPLFRRVYLNSHIRTRKWYQGGEAVVWNDGDELNMRYYA